MRAINHTVTGAAIAAAFPNPWFAVPAALLSHFVLDMIPHSGGGSHTSVFFKVELLLDSALMAGFLLGIALLQPQDWQLLMLCGFLGAAPDLWWIPYWFQDLRGETRRLDPFAKFASVIQWSETKPGYLVEALWLIGSLYIFFSLTAI